jgi:hypothetical protein
MFLRIFKHLLPRAKAWSITIDKRLRQFFDGLTDLGDDIKEFFDEVWLDIFPQTTRELDAWEDQFNLPDNGLTEQERRDRLEATWAANGGQSPRYIQDTIQAAGFTNVYVHEWFDPVGLPAVGVKLCVTPRDPSALTGLELLVNDITVVSPDYIAVFGGANIEMGEDPAQFGNYTDLLTEKVIYEIPTDTDKHAYFVYFGGATYGTKADIPAARQAEFEALILKLKPAHLWAGLLINYI